MKSRPTTGVFRRMLFAGGVLSLVAAGRVAAADTVPAPPDTGWLRQHRGERLFLSLSPDGRYQAVREKDRHDGMISAQRDTGTFTVAAGRIILTRSRSEAPVCRDGFEGAFAYRIVGKRLRLQSFREPSARTVFVPRLDGARAIVPAPPTKAVLGCFQGQQFLPEAPGASKSGAGRAMTGPAWPPSRSSSPHRGT